MSLYVGVVRRLVEKPLTWMVLAEVVVVVALAGVAWHMVAGVPRNPSAQLVLPAVTATPDDTALPDVSPDVLNPPDTATVPLLPGLNVDPAFWRVRLAALNGAEAQVEALAWATYWRYFQWLGAGPSEDEFAALAPGQVTAAVG